MSTSRLTQARCLSCAHQNRAVARFCGMCGRELVQEDATWPGTLVPGTLLGPRGRYRVERRLGRGGFGEVYLAHDTQLDRACVVKRLVRDPSWDQHDWLRAEHNFAREARLLVTLNAPGHPNIPEIYEYLVENNCLVMKYIEGQSLGALMDRRVDPLPVDEALRVVRDVCAALIYMHSHRPEPALHRDVKPANILLDVAGRVWLVDFGLSKVGLPAPARFVPGDTTNLAGTLGFTPAEQWRGEAEPRSDVYALGATLHLLLTNYRPQHAELLALMRGEGELPPARQLNPQIPPAGERLIRWAMASDAAARPTAREFLAELEALLGRTSIPAPPAPARPPEATALVGREAELAALANRLTGHGFAMIAGPAGIGKTTIVAALARRAGDPARTFWHAFRQGEGADRLIWSLAGFLAAQGHEQLWQLLHQPAHSNPASASDRLGDYLVDQLRRLGADAAPPLLCLDDVHVIGDDPHFAALARQVLDLARGGALRLIAAARHVPAWAQPGEITPLAGLNAADVAHLLAAQGLVLPPDLAAALYARTEGNAKFLVLAIDALRHAADQARLIAALAETDDIGSYLMTQVHQHLTVAEQAAMNAVAILLGQAASRDAIEHILDADDQWDVLSGLSRRYLLNATPGPAGMAYGQHALVQAFYYQRMGARKRQVLHRRAAAYYETGEPDPLRAARHYALGDQPLHAARLATANVQTLINRGEARELEHLLARLPDDTLEPVLRAAVAMARGEVLALLGDYPGARAQLERGLAVGTQLGGGLEQVEAQARRYRLLAMVGERTGQYPQAEADCNNGLKLAQDLPLPNLELARLHAQLAELLWRRSQFDAAERACHDGLAALPPEPAAPRERAMLFQRLATIASFRGHYAEAIGGLEQSLGLARQANDVALTAAILHNLGRCLYLSGEGERALECYTESLSYKEQIGDAAGRVYTLNALGAISVNRGDYATALRCFQEVRELCERLNLPESLARAIENIGIVHYFEGHPDRGAVLFDQARVIFESLGDATNVADCLYRLGDAALARGELQAAQGYGEQALNLAREIGSAAYEACALRVIGEALLALGKIDEAAECLAKAWQVQRQVGDPYDETLIQAALARLALARGDRGQASKHVEAGLDLARAQQLPYQTGLLEALQSQVEANRELST